MIELLKRLFHRTTTPPLDIERAVGKYLLELPRCSARVAIVSPRYGDEHYRCDLIVRASDLAQWAEGHAQGVWSSDQDVQAARKALPVWLRGADTDNPMPTFLPPSFTRVVRPYALDFVSEGLTEVFCPDCRQFVSEVTARKFDERRDGSWSYWTDEWRCPAGHLLYLEDHELHLHLRRSDDCSTATSERDRAASSVQCTRLGYREVATDALNKAMAINLREHRTFDGLPINTLEAVIAIYWMVERAIQPLPRERLHLAGAYLMDSLLAWFENDYSPDEIRTLVIPAFSRRLNEYGNLFVLGAGEQPRSAMMRTFGRMVFNVFAREPSTVDQVATAILLWWQPIAAEGARIVELDKSGAIDWTD